MAKSKPKKADGRSASRTIPIALVVAVLAVGVSAVYGLSIYFRGGRRGDMTADSFELAVCRSAAERVKGCTPRGQKGCGRLVRNNFASADEVAALRTIAERGMAMGGGGAGGPTILDLQSGAVSYKDKFIDVWTAFNSSGAAPFTKSDVQVYADLVERIRRLAEATFGASGLQLTEPTFFSRISGDRPPVTAHDEYWHVHVDAKQYGSFVYTALLYLADHGADFTGGSFEFMRSAADPPDAAALVAVPPTKGRLVLFTSGDEHPHRVTRVTAGERLALTIAFTCDERAAITDFLGRALDG